MKIKNIKNNILFSVIYWIVSANFFMMIRMFGVVENGVKIITLDVFFQVTLTGFSIGVLLALMNESKLIKFNKRTSFLFKITVNTFIYLVFFLLVMFFSSSYGNSLAFAKSYMLSEQGIVALIHLGLSSLLFHFILQMNKVFGPGVLLEYISGKYFNPREEDRVFMFLDLKASTTIAEKLEHVKYSKLIQDCFAELTEPAIKYNARIYQYVGDEIVITWKTKEGFSNANCLNFYFDFSRILELKKDYFMEEYGLLPMFKAGIHNGKVTVAEVGKIKTEIAYHGDVLNTASRIQGLCNEHGEQLLISESALNLMECLENYTSKPIGNLKLKGKEQKVNVFSIQTSNNN